MREILVTSLVRKNGIFRKSPSLFYLILLIATNLPLILLSIAFPPTVIGNWMMAMIWKGGLGWQIPWPLLILSSAAPTLIVFLLVTAEKSFSEATNSLKKVATSRTDLSLPNYVNSPYIDIAGVVVAVIIFLEETWPALIRGIPLITSNLDRTWPLAVYLSVNFFTWWFFAGQFAWYSLILTIFFLVKVKKMKIRCNWKTLNSWIRTDYVGGLKPAGISMLRLFRWYLVIVTLAVIGFWLFKTRGYLVFLLFASLFPFFSYFSVAYSLNTLVKRAKRELSKMVENRYLWDRQASYLHYVAQIEEWPIPLKNLGEPFYVMIFWFVTSYVIPELINIMQT